jgi:hypothetical protein
MINKSIKINTIKNLTIIIKKSRHVRPIKKEFIKPSQNKLISDKLTYNEVDVCDDELIQKIIRNGGL